MIICSNCGQHNPEGDMFCRRCGKAFEPPKRRPERESQTDFELSPPGPYSWKSGEYPRSKGRGSRTTRRIDLPQARPASDLPATRKHGPLAPGYRCPRCGTSTLPVITKRVSTAGWVVFATLLVTTLFLFWIGLLLQEEVRVCPVCDLRIG